VELNKLKVRLIGPSMQQLRKLLMVGIPNIDDMELKDIYNRVCGYNIPKALSSRLNITNLILGNYPSMLAKYESRHKSVITYNLNQTSIIEITSSSYSTLIKASLFIHT
jgi:hypothetical protein